MNAEAQLYALIYTTLYGKLEYLWILVFVEVPVTGPLQILRDN